MLRSLGPADVPDLKALIAQNRYTNCFVAHRVDVTGLRPHWLSGDVWGIFRDGKLISACHAAANLVPIEADRDNARMFAQHALSTGTTCSSIVGDQEAVFAMWEVLEPEWGPARSPRFDQPFLLIDTDSVVAADPRVRPVMMDEIGTLYPASVAMFREEVGVDPEANNNTGYRARVAQLIAEGCSFAIIEDGQVIFKAEVGAATVGVCQIQGVWIRPELRGHGIAVPAMAAVVNQVRASFAPAVTLYVNHHNVRARRVYERVGFRQIATFASILR